MIGRVVLTLLVFYLARAAYQTLYHVPPIPDYPETNYWGPGEAKPDDVTIKPFKINVAEDVLTDLNNRLDLELRIQPTLEGMGSEYGLNSGEVKRAVHFWRNLYNWTERQAMLNEMPQFTTQVFGLNLHFVHAKPKNVPKGTKVLPLLLVHGWPGSIKEFQKIIPILTKPMDGADFVFEVIAPSLPGYAFSEASHKPGMNPSQMAIMFRHLMLRLGHEKFYVQGGDWGALIVNVVALLFPQNVQGMHSNMCASNSPASNLYLFISSFWPSLFVDSELASRLYPLSATFSNLMLESGYMHLQATKPDTVGVALNNSPAGLAAYILEKFSSWTDMEYRSRYDGGFTRTTFGVVDVLDNVMLYWVTGSITSSMRLYSEAFNKEYFAEKWDSIPITVPTFCAQFPNELFTQPHFILHLKYLNLYPRDVPKTDDPLYPAVRPPRGGHFAAMEEPTLLANSLVQAIKLFDQAAK